MCKCIDFTAQLAEKFPWNNLEKEVDGTIFKNVFWEEDSELFWVRLNEVLELHKEEAPLRCVDILDFIGRNAIGRPDDITLCHYRYTDFSTLVLQYFAEAVKQRRVLSVLQFLMLMDIVFESRNEPGLNQRARQVLAEVNSKRISVCNAELEGEYCRGYHYLWDNNGQYKIFAAHYNLL